MITYVINTSENRTFESDTLFDVAGYNKIRWMKCRLDEIKRCALEIYEKQNILAAEQFRVAVIVDFYGFDRIRTPYGKEGYGEEKGVDLSLYMPYIEMFLADNLIATLERQEMVAADYEVFYVQSSKFERYECLDNAEEQLRYILSGAGEPESYDLWQKTDENVEVESKEVSDEKEALFSEYSLYCTSTVSLNFKLSDYPYCDAVRPLSFSEFYLAANQRAGNNKVIRPHYYVTSYGSGAVRSAYDTLSLSLYLINIYEREESFLDEGDMEVPHIDGDVLKDVLETSWVKLAVAKEYAAVHDSKYYSLNQNINEIKNTIKEQEKNSIEDSLEKQRTEVLLKSNKLKKSVDTMYRYIKECDEKDSNAVNEENRAEFDSIFSKYLEKRDSTNEKNVEQDFDNLRQMGALVTTDQCPSREQYNYAVKSRQKDISELFKRALSAEYLSMEYNEEREKAEEAYYEYSKWRACVNKSVLADLLFLIISVFFTVYPYKVLQVDGMFDLTIGKGILLWITIAAVSGVFVLAFLINLIMMVFRMKAEKNKIKDCYITCLAKQRYSFSELRRRYQYELIRIEEARYEIRQITHLFELNLAKEQRVAYHRMMLEKIQDKVGSMLNNLGVQPVYDSDQSIFNEFNIEKSVYSKDNRVYQVFSIETIERLFPKRRGED
ncbi:MAG: hypothetical protein IKJ59_10900 [Clostridia bacterium]|nr:hypothetical protein [Clostridia bacterium]